ncbi:MAG: stage II sporulation protein P [Halanaerobiaceae bacterium]|nr:stage II sporulation protein P [Halanaerobiaceae bacterium]
MFFIYTFRLEAGNLIGHREEDIFNVYDTEGNYIFAIAMEVSEGDRYIDENNQEYLVIEVQGRRAVAEKKGKIDLLQDTDLEIYALTPIAARGTAHIGLYHTHNGESYLPGPNNIDGIGEIHEVGDVLKNALEEKGFTVTKLDNIHLPHDGAAYERSRNTVSDLLKKRPDAIFDVHRDAIPRKEEYLKEINGQQVSQIRLVVGRQNSNYEVNDQFAKSIKAVADEQYPGLIKGIFYGRGSYNQQFAPRSLLLEFGTHVTTKEQAVASARMLADSISRIIYGNNAGERDLNTGENRSSLSSIGRILLLAIGGIMIFLFINEGSFDGVISRIKSFFKKELK